MERTRIVEKSLLEAGFVKNRNMYTKNGESVQLIKGHTWEYMKNNWKFSKSVKYIEDMV